MKCPHCGIEVRDTTTVCMYCGGKIPRRKGTPPPAGKATDIGPRAPKAPVSKRPGARSDDEGEEEEERSPSSFLEAGEQILIGSLNVMVKKFFFNAYLTNKRIFLIDTAEKKLKATSKDIPLDTISGSIVEYSENSDPVLVLTIRSSADEDIKTMKLVFAGDGMDRSGEIAEWVELLTEQTELPVRQKKPHAKKAPAPAPEEFKEEAGEEEEEGPIAPVRRPEPVRQEFRPAKRPVKDHEKQPPVKRLISVYQPEPMEEMPEERIPAPRPVKAPEPQEPGRKVSLQQPSYREIPQDREQAAKPVRKVEVQSAMKGALEGAVPPAKQPADKIKAQTPSLKKPVIVQPETKEAVPVKEEPVQHEEVPGDETAVPLFCQNCGKKLPGSANFCPGCGTKITAHREKNAPRPQVKTVKKQTEPAQAQEKKENREEKHTAKKAQKGSEMTILHKFLRR